MKQSEVINAFNSTSWYPVDLLNIDINFFDSMVTHISPVNIQTPKTDLLIYFYLYLIVLLRLNFMINEMNLIFILRIFLY